MLLLFSTFNPIQREPIDVFREIHLHLIEPCLLSCVQLSWSFFYDICGDSLMVGNPLLMNSPPGLALYSYNISL